MDNNDTQEIKNIKVQFSKRKLLISLALIIFLVLGAIFVLLRQTPTQQQKPLPNQTTYTDQGKFFSIQIPRSWTTSADVAQGETGIGTDHMTTQNIEETQLGTNDGFGVAIQAYEGTPACPLSQPLTTTLAGLPASYDPLLNAWTIPTTKALIIVTIAYPGSNEIHHGLMQDIPTPVPAVVTEQNRKSIMNILNTLNLTNLVPFKC